MKQYKMLSQILHEKDYLGPKTNFKPKKDEKILFECENISLLEDTRMVKFGENLDPRGILIITNQRVSFQPKYFSVGKEENTEIALESISTVKFKFSKIFNRSLEINYIDEKRKFRFAILWAPLFLKSYGGINSSGFLFRKLKEAYNLLIKLTQ